MNTVLALIGAISSFWISAELVLEWNQPLLALVFGIGFAVMCLMSVVQASRELRGGSEEMKGLIQSFRRRNSDSMDM